MDCLTDAAQGAPPVIGSKNLVLLLVMVASGGYLCRVAVTVAAPGIMRDFGLTQAQMGTVFSAFLLGYTIFQVPSGWLADHISVRRIYLVLCIGWSFLTALTGAVAWHGFALAFVLPQLWLLRVLFGLIAAPTYPTSGRTIAVAVPPLLHARANSVVLASIGIGSALAPVLLAPLTNRFGWRSALLTTAALTGVVGLLWWRFAPRQTHLPETSINRLTTGSPEITARPLRSSSFWFLCASYLLQGYLGYIFIFWFYLYLVQVRHFEALRAAGFTVLPWVATILGIPLGGVLSDAAAQRWGGTWGRRSVPITALLVSGICLVVGARTSHAMVAVAALTACTVLVLCTEGPYWASMTQLAGKSSGVAGGTMNFGSNLGGMVSPAFTPWLAAHIGWESALTFTAGVAIVAALLWLGVSVDLRES